MAVGRRREQKPAGGVEREPPAPLGAGEALQAGCDDFSGLLPKRKGLKLQTGTCCGGVKATTLFSSLQGPGVKCPLSEDTVSSSGLARVQGAAGAEVLQRHPGRCWGFRSFASSPKHLFTPSRGGVARLSPPPWPRSPCQQPGRDFGSEEGLSLATGWGAPGHAPPASHPGAAGKGRGGKINGSFVSRLRLLERARRDEKWQSGGSS